MKTFRRLLRSFVPYGILRRCVNRKYGFEWPALGGSVMSGVLYDVAPALFAFAMSGAGVADCGTSPERPMKFLLPYGFMKRWMWRKYAVEVGTSRHHGFVVEALRAVMPYGYILWWDGDDNFIAPWMRGEAETFRMDSHLSVWSASWETEWVSHPYSATVEGVGVADLIGDCRTALVTDCYPDALNPGYNMFAHARLLDLTSRTGEKILCVCVKENSRSVKSRDYDGVRVVQVGLAGLEQIAARLDSAWIQHPDRQILEVFSRLPSCKVRVGFWPDTSTSEGRGDAVG